MNSIDFALGEICKLLFPIHEEVYFGDQKSSLGVCTLSSISLLKEIKNSNILEKIGVAGRLFSENKGIDTLIHYINSNTNIQTLIICGHDSIGHKAGQALICLHKNGIQDQRIIGATGSDPTLLSSMSEIEYFRNQITLIDKMGETNFQKIKQIVESF